MNTVRRNIILNGIANIGQKGVNVANQLLLVPFFLDAWGAEYYGEWLTLTTIPSILMFSDMGFSTSASNAFVLAYSGRERQKAANIYKTGLLLTTCCILLGVLLSFGVMVFAKSTGLLDKSLITANDAIWALTFMMAGRLTGFYNQLFEGFFRSKHKAATSINYNTVGSLVTITLGIYVLLKGYGIVAYALSILITSVIFNIGYALIAIHVIGELPHGNYDKTEAKTICYKGFGYMASPLWQVIYFQGTTLVVRTVLGAEAVAVFNTVRKVCRSVNQMFGIVNGSIFPELQIAIGENNMMLARSILWKSVKFVFILGVIGVLLLSTVGPIIYNWWTKDMLTMPTGIWLLFMLGILFNALWWTAGCTFRAINEPYRLAVYGFFASCLTVFTTYLLSNVWEMTGAAIGYILFDVLMVLMVVPYVVKLFDTKKYKVHEKNNGDNSCQSRKYKIKE